MPGVSPDTLRAPRSTVDSRTYEAFRGDETVEVFSGLPLELHSQPEPLKTKFRTVDRLLRTNRQELINFLRELLVDDWGFNEEVQLRIVSEVDDRDLAVLIQIENAPDEQHLFVFLRCTECAAGAGGFSSGGGGFSSGGGTAIKLRGFEDS